MSATTSATTARHPHTLHLVIGCVAACAGAISCTPGPERFAPAQVVAPVVYGDDDRRDVYAFDDPAWAERAVGFTVALVAPDVIDASDPAAVRLDAGTLRAEFDVCADERFADQPTAAFCSGTLIAPDLVLTAGHCVQSQAECDDTALVFDYFMTDAATAHPIAAADVFACAELIVGSYTGGLDYAVLRLDRPAAGRTPATVDAEGGALPAGTDLVVSGFPSGLPIKLDGGGAVRDPREFTRDYFVANLDTFGGNSGSGVFAAESGHLAGILVRGEVDYRFDSAAGCYRVHACPDDGCSGEEATYAFRAVDALCAQGPHSVCACGDGTCDTAGGETTATCTADCGAACGDGACTGDESPTTCPTDCGTCGDGTCNGDETAASCCTDCGCAGTDVCEANACVLDPTLGDTCAAPLPVVSGGPSSPGGAGGPDGPGGTYILMHDTSTAGDDASGSCAAGVHAPDRVYSFTVAETTAFEARATGFDTVLYLRTRCDDDTSERACNDDAAPPADLGSRIAQTLPPGTYYLFVDGYASSGGPYTLTVSLAPGCADGDGDGACDTNDGCPADPAKTEPGVCGCGVPDGNSDGDGDPDGDGACGCDGACGGGGCRITAGASGDAPAGLLLVIAGLVAARVRRRRRRR